MNETFHSYIHPPNVVTISPHRLDIVGRQPGRQTPDTTSPLSSAPNTPHRCDTSTGGDDWEMTMPTSMKHSHLDIKVPVPVAKQDVVPFDEGGEHDNDNDAPDDEKKLDEGDELMGKQPSRNSRKCSYLQEEEEEEADEPPSLALRKPFRIRERAKTTGDLVKPLTSPNRKTDMQQHLNFAALKRDILSMNSKQPPPQTLDTVAMTPTQELRSPPKVLKQRMWETSTSISADADADPLQGQTKTSNYNAVQVATSMSPATESAWPSFYDTSYDMDNMDDTGKIPFKKPKPWSPYRPYSEDRRENAYYQKHRQVYSEDEGDRVLVCKDENDKITSHPHDEQEKSDNSVPEDEQKATTATATTSTPTPRDMDVTVTVPKLTTRSVSEPEDQYKLQDPLFPSTSSFDFATSTTGAAAVNVGDHVFGAKQEDQKTQRQRQRPGGSLVRSVSDAPASGNHNSTHNRASLNNDWGAYLSTRGVGSANANSNQNTTAGLDNYVSNQIGISSWVEGRRDASNRNQKPGAYRKMTPKKDFLSSDKSAAWLQEELKRRSIIKSEINVAILARNEPLPTDLRLDDNGFGFAEELTKALEACLPIPHNESTDDYDAKVNVQASQSTEDDEVAAITDDEPNTNTAGRKNSRDQPPIIHEQGFEMQMQYTSDRDANLEKPVPRRLDYNNGNVNAAADSSHPTISSSGTCSPKRSTRSRSTLGSEETFSIRTGATDSIHSSANNSKQSSEQNGQPVGRLPELLASEGFGDDNLNNQSLDAELKEEMKRFASDTRAALRWKVEPDTGKDDPNVLKSTFRSLAISSSVGSTVPEEFRAIEVDVSFKDSVRILSRPSASEDPSLSVSRSSASRVVLSNSEGAFSDESDFADIQNMTPVLVQTMDSVYGIAKGDVTLSLLNENTGRIETSKKATWVNRVHGAIWRCRRMRRSMGGFPSLESQMLLGSPAKGRSSLPVDTDKARVAGGFQSVAATQDAALEHLKHDEIDEALELFEDIIFSYYSYFERSLKVRELNPSLQGGLGTTDFKPYIGVALHNLGILNLLNGEYKEALSFFTRAIDNRKSCLGEGHPDHVSSLVKLAICLYALNEFAEAHARLEEALEFVRQRCPTLEDRVQMAEILNNLGCLAYMCGQPVAAKAFFTDSLDVQFMALSESLYESSALIGQSISLNISITRANIGFVKLVKKDLPVAVTALENALMEQQILLKGAHDTVIATMDHLAVANLLNGDQQKAAQMFCRILQLQHSEYGPHDRRCFVTIDKINMVRSQGTNFEQAVEELRKTFSMPEDTRPAHAAPPDASEIKEGKAQQVSVRAQSAPLSKAKGHKNKVLKALTSIRKKKPAAPR